MMKALITKVSPVLMLPLAFCLFAVGVVMLIVAFLSAIADNAFPSLKMNKTRRIREAKVVKITERSFETATLSA